MMKRNRFMKQFFAMMMALVMVGSLMSVNVAHAIIKTDYSGEVDAWGTIEDYGAAAGWVKAADEEDNFSALDDISYEGIKSTAGFEYKDYYYQTLDGNYLIDALYVDGDFEYGGEFYLCGRGDVPSQTVNAPNGGGRFLLRGGKLYLLAGNCKTKDVNVVYDNLAYNIQTEALPNSPNPLFPILEIQEDGKIKLTVPEGATTTLDGVVKQPGTYTIPETGQENPRQDAKDEIKGNADKAKEDIDKLPALTDEDKNKAKEDIDAAVNKGNTAIDAAETRNDIDVAKSDANKSITDAVAKAEELSKQKQQTGTTGSTNNSTTTGTQDSNKQQADSFIKDNLTDDNGNIITKVTEENIIKIFTAKEKWDSFSQEVKDIINQLLQAAGGQTFDALFGSATAMTQKFDKELNDSFDTGTIPATTKSTTKSATIKWKKLAGEDGYFIYTNVCNKNEKKNKLKKVKDVKAGAKASYKKTKLKKNKWYKYRVVAYKIVNGKKLAIGQSLLMHSYTGTKTSKLSNPSKVTAKKKTISIKVGKKGKMNAKVVMPKGKKLKVHTDKLRYIVSDKSVATVNKKGKIKAKKKGTCTVYVCAQNGVYKVVKVKVK